MSYRDDLAAAQARADAAMRSLEAEKRGRADDEERIAKLERSLADAMTALIALREQQPRVEPSPTIPNTAGSMRPGLPGRGTRGALWLFGGLAALVLIILYLVARSGVDDRDQGVAFTSDGELATDLAMDELDVSAQIERAQRAAEAYFGPDLVGSARLVGIRAWAVDDGGKSDLRYGSATYFFKAELSPMPFVEDDAPVGARGAQFDNRACHVEVRFDRSGLHLPDPILSIVPASLLTSRCEALEVNPSCTLAEVRARAIAQGAPRNSVASVVFGDSEEGMVECGEMDCLVNSAKPCCVEGFNAADYRPDWRVTIIDQGRELFAGSIPDDCGLRADTP